MNIDELIKLQRNARNISLFFIILILSAMGVSYFYYNSVSGLIWVLLIGLFLYFIITPIYNKKFYSAFREMYAKRVYETFLKNIKYEEEVLLHDARDLEETKCFKNEDYFDSSDIVSGQFNDIKFKEAFIDFGSIGSDADGHSRKSPYFSGKWMIFEFNKSFLNEVHIYSKGISKFGINKKDNNFEKMIFDDEKFDKYFTVYSRNICDTKKMINETIMQKLYDMLIESRVPFVMCFKDNKLHIGIHTFSNDFNYSLYKKIDDQVILDFLTKNYKIFNKFVNEVNKSNNFFNK